MGPTERAFAVLKPPVAVLCDFDDTTAVENVAELVMERFGGEEWLDFRRRFREGDLTLRQYQEMAFNSVRANRDEMMEAVRERATLRPGFKEMYDYCRRREVPLAVVTNGLDFYVEALIKREGLDGLPVYAVQTRFSNNGPAFSYPHAREGCSDYGNCKCKVLEEFRKDGFRVIYAGDSRSDYCAAAHADLVFAHKGLTSFCRTYGINYLPLNDFFDVLNVVKQVTEEGALD